MGYKMKYTNGKRADSSAFPFKIEQSSAISDSPAKFMPLVGGITGGVKAIRQGGSLGEVYGRALTGSLTGGLLTGPDSIRRLVINNAGTIMKEQNVDFGEATQIIYNAILNDPKLNKVFAKDIEALGLNLNIGNKTDTSGFKVIKEN